LFDSEKIWTAALYVLAISYTAYCSFIFGSLLASETDTLGALLKFGDTYGTIVTGAPVLVGVVVAKQQMDANRRQHVANVKRSLRQELECLANVSHFARSTTNASVMGAEIAATFSNQEKLYFYRPTKDELETWRPNVPPYIYGLVQTLREDIEALSKLNASKDLSTAEDSLDQAKTGAAEILACLSVHYRQLSQYWS